MLRLGDQFDQFHKVSRHLSPEKIRAKPVKRLHERDLAKRMEVALAARGIADVLKEEEIQLPGKGAPRPASPLRNGFEPALILREPGNNPARIAQTRTAKQDRRGAIHNDSFDARRRMGKKSFMAEEATQSGAGENSPAIDTGTLKTTYANVCRIAQTPNEMIVDFGLNPNFFGTILPEPLKLETRIVMSHDAAKRLLLHLANSIQSYEAKYGVIELDIAKRIKPGN
jgi:hypothetical protein